jgi:hypothetical protein
MGQGISIVAVQNDKNDADTEHIYQACVGVINGEWTDYIDLLSKIFIEAEKAGVKLRSVTIDALTTNLRSNYVRIVNQNYSSYGKNYLVLKRTGMTIFHYNFRLIVAW